MGPGMGLEAGLALQREPRLKWGGSVATLQPPQNPAQSGGHSHLWAPMESPCLNQGGSTAPSQSPWKSRDVLGDWGWHHSPHSQSVL